MAFEPARRPSLQSRGGKNRPQGRQQHRLCMERRRPAARLLNSGPLIHAGPEPEAGASLRQHRAGLRRATGLRQEPAGLRHGRTPNTRHFHSSFPLLSPRTPSKMIFPKKPCNSGNLILWIAHFGLRLAPNQFSGL